MTVYVLNVIISGLLCIPLISKETNEINVSRVPKHAGVFLLLLLWWTFLFSFRYKVGSDSWALNAAYHYLSQGSVPFDYWMAIHRDFIFTALEYLCAVTWGFNRLSFYILVALLIYIPVLITIRNESSSPVFSLILFILTLQIYYGYNGTRQAIATSIMMMAYYLFFRKKHYIRYGIGMFLAYGFHAAVLFVIPFHFLSTRKFKSPWVLFVAVCLIVSFFALSSLWSGMIQIFDLFGQEKMARDYATFTERSANIIRVLVAIPPVLLCFWKYDEIKKSFPDCDGEMILLFVSCILTFFIIRTPIFARFAAFTSFTTIFIIPKIVCGLKPENRNLLSLLIFCFYFIFMLGVIASGSSHLYPYQFLPNLNATW